MENATLEEGATHSTRHIKAGTPQSKKAHHLTRGRSATAQEGNDTTTQDGRDGERKRKWKPQHKIEGTTEERSTTTQRIITAQVNDK